MTGQCVNKDEIYVGSKNTGTVRATRKRSTSASLRENLLRNMTII